MSGARPGWNSPQGLAGLAKSDSPWASPNGLSVGARTWPPQRHVELPGPEHSPERWQRPEVLRVRHELVESQRRRLQRRGYAGQRLDHEAEPTRVRLRPRHLDEEP